MKFIIETYYGLKQLSFLLQWINVAKCLSQEWYLQVNQKTIWTLTNIITRMPTTQNSCCQNTFLKVTHHMKTIFSGFLLIIYICIYLCSSKLCMAKCHISQNEIMNVQQHNEFNNILRSVNCFRSYFNH